MSRHLNVTRAVADIDVGIYPPGKIPKAKAMWLVSRGFANYCDKPKDAPLPKAAKTSSAKETDN